MSINEHKNRNQSDACLHLADVIIENNTENIEEYKREFYKALETLGIKDDNNISK